ncbi:sigma-70 family RNA polymerase sigma factor [Candidatus Gracilibacteria bacterium]|nr:sigma-70 family RNA polymerase sigma factor [Candidatus Gracilibacteria bacterium]
MSIADMPHFSLEQVAAGCRAEAERSRSTELGYCFELFRRALEQLDQAAWQAVVAQYQRLILRWLHGVGLSTDDTLAEDVAHEVIERFWRTLAGRCTPLTARFPHVGALLKYMRQCAVTTVLDRRRSERQRERLLEQAQHAYQLDLPVATAGEDDIVERIARSEQLHRVRAWVKAEVGDPLEQLVLRLSYSDDLSPAEIASRYPEHFADAALVRQIKERVLRRARRALLDSGTDAAEPLSD